MHESPEKSSTPSNKDNFCFLERLFRLLIVWKLNIFTQCYSQYGAEVCKGWVGKVEVIKLWQKYAAVYRKSEIFLLHEMRQPSNTNNGYGDNLAYRTAHNSAHAMRHTRVLDVQILNTKFLYILYIKHKPLPKIVNTHSITSVKMQTTRI